MKPTANLSACIWLGAAMLAPAAETGILPGYTPHATLATQLQDLARQPGVKLQSIGQTLGGREVYQLTLAGGQPSDKPAILILGNVWGPQLLGGELAVRLARRIASDDAQAKKLLERFSIHIIPRPAPDASEAFFTKPHLRREGNLRPTDSDHDGKFNEDGPDDLNHDGLITQIRVADPTGTMIPHPDDRRIMLEADPRKKQEHGQYKVYVEGLDNDHDEKFNEDGPGGVDLNKNFTFEYPFFQPGAGPHQASEIETRAVIDFAFDHPEIAAVFCFSPQDNLMHPWKPNPGQDRGKIKTSVLPSDAPYFQQIAQKYQKRHGGKDAPDNADTGGDFVHWAYFHFGRWSFGARGWWIPKIEGDTKKDEPKEEPKGKKKAAPGKTPDKTPDKPKDDRAAEMINALRWFDQRKIDAFVPWTPIDHPDFAGKKVEVGGIKPFYLLNPPADRLDDLADRHFKFLIELADLLPQIKIQETKVEPLGGGVYRLAVTVANTGYLPTMSAMGKLTGTPNPLQMHWTLPEGARFIQGFARKLIDPIAGSGGHAEHTWLVRCSPGPAAIRVHSPTVGSASQTVQLP